MNLDQLKVFIAVAEQKSFARAADSLYISYSTTSRNVASLEDSLGIRLLIRNNRSVSLTPAGELLYKEGVRLIKKVREIKEAVGDAGRSPSP